MPSDTECAYAAGMIDADGSIMISRAASKLNSSGFSYAPVISITSIDTNALDWMIDKFGGGSYRKGHKPDPNSILKSNFQAYYWTAANKKALEIIKLIEPYLVIKKKQASLVVKFYEEALWKKGGRASGLIRGGSSMPEIELSRREDLRNECRALNSRSYLSRITPD